MSYGALILGITNGSIQDGVNPETLDSLPAIIPLLAINLVGAIVAFYCLFSFIGHLFTENKRVTGAGKALWLLLLLLGNFVAMPAYWYLYIVRERLSVDQEGPAEVEKAAPAPKTLA